MKLFIYLIFLFPVFYCHSQQNIDSLLVYNYEFNGNTDDSSPNAFNATSQNITYVEDRNGNPNSAVHFNGNNAYIELPNHPDLKPTYPMTFSFWVKLESHATEDVRMFTNDYVENSYTGVWISFPPPSNGAAFNIGDGTPNNTGPNSRRTSRTEEAVPLEQWTHVVGIIRGPLDMDIYLDCRQKENIYNGTGGALAYSNEPGNIGRYDFTGNPPFYFNGALDDFRLYSRELSLSEIYTLCDTDLSTHEVTEKKTQFSAQLYPNPTNKTINIDTDYTDEFEVTIISVEGKQIFDFNRNGNELDVSSLNSGTYFIKLTSAKNEAFYKTLRFVKYD